MSPFGYSSVEIITPKANTNRTRTEVTILRYKTGKTPSRCHTVLFLGGLAWLPQYHSQIWLGSKRDVGSRAGASDWGPLDPCGIKEPR